MSEGGDHQKDRNGSKAKRLLPGDKLRSAFRVIQTSGRGASNISNGFDHDPSRLVSNAEF